MGNIVARTSEPGLSVALGASVASSGGASCHSIRIFRHSIVGLTVRTLRHFSGGARPVCWCVVHVVFAFHLHVPCSETVLASRLVLLFKDAGGETVQPGSKYLLPGWSS